MRLQSTLRATEQEPAASVPEKQCLLPSKHREECLGDHGSRGQWYICKYWNRRVFCAQFAP